MRRTRRPQGRARQGERVKEKRRMERKHLPTLTILFSKGAWRGRRNGEERKRDAAQKALLPRAAPAPSPPARPPHTRHSAPKSPLTVEFEPWGHGAGVCRLEGPLRGRLAKHWRRRGKKQRSPLCGPRCPLCRHCLPCATPPWVCALYGRPVRSVSAGINPSHQAVGGPGRNSRMRPRRKTVRPRLDRENVATPAGRGSGWAHTPRPPTLGFLVSALTHRLG